MSIVSKISIPMMAIMFIVGCLGNTLIIIFFTWTRGGGTLRRHPYTLFLVHLAVADFIACFVVPIYYIPQDLTGGHWYYGKFLCEYTIFIATGVTMYASCWILFGIIYERYRSLVHPLHRKMTRKYIHLFCFGAWILSFLFHIPYFMATSLTENESGVLQCKSSPASIFKDPTMYIVYYALRLVFQSFLPVMLMVFYFVRITRAISKSTKRHETLGIKRNGKLKYQRQKRSIIRAIKITLTVFSVTISLNNVSHVIRAVMKTYFWEIWHDNLVLQMAVDFFIRFLAINNIIICFIYTGSMRSFRTFVLDVLRCRLSTRHKKSHSTKDEFTRSSVNHQD